MRHQKNIYFHLLFIFCKKGINLNYLMPGGNEKVTRT